MHNVSVTTPYGQVLPFEAEGPDSRGVIWFDIDNCLYSKRAGVAEQMGYALRRSVSP